MYYFQIVSLSPFLQVIKFGAGNSRFCQSLQCVFVYCLFIVFISALEYSLYAASASSSDAFLEALDFILKAQPLQMLLLKLQAEFVEPCSTMDDDASSKIFYALKAHSLGMLF
jgi:hypothetical protein